jgi:(S)-citramalyl-CoA lyase
MTGQITTLAAQAQIDDRHRAAAAARTAAAPLARRRRGGVGQVALIGSGPTDDARLPAATADAAAALARLDEIAGATPRLAALLLGSADLSADLRAANGWESLLYARSHLVRAAAAAGLDVLDAPCFDLSEPGTLEEEARGAQRLGFTGKCAIHPKHIATINATFSPAAGEVGEARLILAENEKGVGVVGGRMIDEAMARRARRVLALAERTGAGRAGGEGDR